MSGDVGYGNAGSSELRSIDGNEVEMEAAAAGAPGELSGELCGDFSAHLVAAGADRGTQDRGQVFRPFTERGEGGDPGGGRVFRRASPAGMNGGDGAGAGEDDRNAVRGLDDEGDSGEARREDVASAGVPDLSGLRRNLDPRRGVAMDLRRSRDRNPRKRQRIGEPAGEVLRRGSDAFRSDAPAGEGDEKAARRGRGTPREEPIEFLLDPIGHKKILRRAVRRPHPHPGLPAARFAGTWPSATAGAEVRREETPRAPPRREREGMLEFFGVFARNA
jgi:hypothetical protein